MFIKLLLLDYLIILFCRKQIMYNAEYLRHSIKNKYKKKNSN